MKKSKEIILVAALLCLMIFGMTFSGISEIFGTVEGILPKCLFISAYCYTVLLVSFSTVTFAVYVTVCRIGNCIEIRKILIKTVAILCQCNGLVGVLLSGDKVWMIEGVVLATIFWVVGNFEVVFRVGDKVYCYNGFLKFEEVVNKEA